MVLTGEPGSQKGETYGKENYKNWSLSARNTHKKQHRFCGCALTAVSAQELQSRRIRPRAQVQYYSRMIQDKDGLGICRHLCR
ncbi:MAG: hypothetical protein ACLR0U_25775 [Enterocloster clostridioformis]